MSLRRWALRAKGSGPRRVGEPSSPTPLPGVPTPRIGRASGHDVGDRAAASETNSHGCQGRGVALETMTDYVNKPAETGIDWSPVS
jgi:hypothetical protein